MNNLLMPLCSIELLLKEKHKILSSIKKKTFKLEFINIILEFLSVHLDFIGDKA